MSHLPEATPSTYSTKTYFIWLVVAIILIGVGQRTVDLFSGIYPDTDDIFRLQQVRDLIAGQDWYDVNQRRLLTPEGGAMHWSRLPDIFLATLVQIFTPFFGASDAEKIAAAIWPLSLLALTLGVLLHILRHYGVSILGQIIGLVFLATSNVIYNFWPGRIDHHNLVSLSILVGYAALLDRYRSVKSAILAGLAICIALSVAIESLPFALALIGCFGLAWVVRGHQEASRMVVFGMSLIGFSTLFLIADAPGLSAARQVCDAFSFAHWGGLIAGGCGLISIGLFAGNVYDWRVRFGLGAGIAIICLIVVAAINPVCLGDPYSNVPEIVRTQWLSVVGEAQTLPDLWDNNPRRAIHQFGFAAAGCVAALIFAASGKAPNRLDRWALLILMAIATAATVWQIRGVTFSHLFGVIVAAWLVAVLFDMWRREGGGPRLLSFGVAALLLGPMNWNMISQYYPVPAAPEAESIPMNVACRTPSLFEALPHDKALKIFSPIDLGIPIIVLTPHSSFAGPYHRNVQGLANVIEIWTGSPAAAHGKLKAINADHLLICPGMNETDRYLNRFPDSLAAELSQNNLPDWLETVHSETKDGAVFTLYRIKP